jgi:16S rRNA (cytidine1402-2'-O)-methyltransferase
LHLAVNQNSNMSHDSPTPPASRTGRLFLIPVPLTDAPEGLSQCPPALGSTLATLRHFIVEAPKTARRHLKALGYPHPLASATLTVLDEHTPPEALPALLQPLLAGLDAGLMSEAGCPAVADPGARLVRLAHELGIPVIPLVGPSALLLALMGSGLNGQRFAFQGYLPVEARARQARIQALEKRSRNERETQLFIETPYRNDLLFQALCESLSEKTWLTIAIDLTDSRQSISTHTVAQWRASPLPVIGKHPAVFLFLAE